MTETGKENFFDDKPLANQNGAGEYHLHVDLGSYEGPLDALLALARDQKVDLAQISVVKLADQYLAFIAVLKNQNLEVAADYLVMAAWLAYLKSRLLLPEPPKEEEPSPEQMSQLLQWQLQRLSAMQEAGQKLLSRARLGIDVFPNGMATGIKVFHHPRYDVTLYDFLSAYGDFKQRTKTRQYTIDPDSLDTIEAALLRLRERVGKVPHWESLISFLPNGWEFQGVAGRSRLAATLSASLELAKIGEVQIRQMQSFGPIYIRKKSNDEISPE